MNLKHFIKLSVKIMTTQVISVKSSICLSVEEKKENILNLDI